MTSTAGEPRGSDRGREGGVAADVGWAVGPDGRYALGDLLGRGGMADVYQAHDQVLGRDVAVKLLRDRTPDPVERDRFVAEALTLARLNHPNLVTILDAGISDEHPYLVLELVMGSNLSAVLKRGDGTLSPRRVASIGAQIAAALAHCHAAGIVHRDVKPGNILIGSDDRALLTDFGISRLLDDSAHHTQTGSTIGTAGYLAPEQVHGGEVTPAVDVYALGLVLLEACTGRREYTGTPVEAAVARLHRSPRIPVGLPPALTSVLSALTQTDPAIRPTAVDTVHSLNDQVAAVWDPGAASPSANDAPDVATAAHTLGGAVGDRGDDDAHLAASDSVIASGTRRQRKVPFLAVTGWVTAAAAVIALVLTLSNMSSTPAQPSGAAKSEPTVAAPKTSTSKVTPAAKLEPSTAAPKVARPGSANTRRHAKHKKAVHAAARTKAKKTKQAVHGRSKGHASPRPKRK